MKHQIAAPERQFRAEVVITITDKNRRLMGQATGQPQAELFAESNRKIN